MNGWKCEACGLRFVGAHCSADDCNETGVNVQLCLSCYTTGRRVEPPPPVFTSHDTNAGSHSVIAGEGHHPVTGRPDGEPNGLVCVRLESGMSVYRERMTAREAVRLASMLLAAANALPGAMWGECDVDR